MKSNSQPSRPRTTTQEKPNNKRQKKILFTAGFFEEVERLYAAWDKKTDGEEEKDEEGEDDEEDEEDDEGEEDEDEDEADEVLITDKMREYIEAELDRIIAEHINNEKNEHEIVPLDTDEWLTPENKLVPGVSLEQRIVSFRENLADEPRLEPEFMLEATRALREAMA